MSLPIQADAHAPAGAFEPSHQTTRLETLGRLAGGVAHDVNNFLTPIIGALEMLALEHPEASEPHRVAIAGLHAAERCAGLVERLLAFSGARPRLPEALDCAAILEGVRSLLRSTLPDAVELDFAAAAVPQVLADRSELDSALLNLCLNAIEAMPCGGCLTVQAEEVSLEAPSAPGGLRPGRYVRFRIEDTGHGMSAETLARAAKPFFTTKGESGAGLGLSSVLGFVRGCGGELEIDSAPGHGARIDLWLPAAERPGSAQPAAAAQDGPSARGSRVLVVDDDDLIRAQTARLLQSLGCKAHVAEDGPSALAVMASGLQVDLLLADVVLPNGLNGPALFARARSLLPDLKVIFTSGYLGEIAGARHSGGIFVAKPYCRAQLAQAMDAALAPVAASSAEVPAPPWRTSGGLPCRKL